jgi:hypothetical protein
MRSALLIFIKNPSLGRVKTRLAQTVGEYNALKIYQYLLDHTMEITYNLNMDRFIYYDEFIPTKDEWPAGLYQKAMQRGTNLGEKMQSAFQEIFEEDYRKAVLIMPDCPKMTDTLIEKAFKMLDTHDFVVGPTDDGGFYLLGMHAESPELFAGKTYETATLFEDTIKRIEATGKTYFRLPILTDVDKEEDLGRLKKMIQMQV